MGVVAYSGTLTKRQERILFALCREYVATGRPVSSSALSRTQGLRWSSATIRNELAALERAGFLHQPHHSAGRLPTPGGLGAYVGAIQDPRRERDGLPLEVRRALDLAFGDVVSSPSQLRSAVHVLSSVGGCVAVTFVGCDRQGVIKQLDLLPLAGANALVVMSLDDGTSSSQTISLGALPGGADQAALRALVERLRWLCEGKTLEAAREELRTLLDAEEARFDQLFGVALRVGLWMCTVAGLDPLWVHIAGRRLLTSLADAARFSEVLALLEDYHRLAEVLCQLLPPSEMDADGRPRAEVHVGVAVTLPHAVGTLTGAAAPAVLSGMSLVGCRAPLPAGAPGRHASLVRTSGVALLGPDRMDYERVIPLVEYAAQALASRTGA